MEEIYNRYYTLLDLRYPGPNGYVVRTCHNPFGGGHSAIYVGGSDDSGVSQAADKLIEVLNAAGGTQGELSVGRLMEIKLRDGVEVPTDLREFEIWEASAGYGSTGYFGWNSISKRMAMYYMTGDEFQAREALRLAFPDDQAKAEISDIDGERIEDKDDPLKGPYHYNAHMVTMFWDLIEESPAFTDEERLAVTNGLSRQINHRKGEGIYGLTQPPSALGSRHGQWSAVSLYVLGRYFAKDYDDPIWPHCERAGALHFQCLHETAWIAGESDNLFWYSTGIAPIFTYLALTGDRVPLENGVLDELLTAQEILASGRPNDTMLRSASMGYLHKAAYLTQDGRWVGYRDRTGVDLSLFRLGQSFWPEEHLAPVPPDNLPGKWTLNPLPVPMWAARNNGFPHDESFQFGSYRSAADSSGDFVLLDGFNGASRNPYHTFAILDLRIDGVPILQGYRNQVLTRADGLVESHIAMNGALRARGVIGDTAYCVGEVPDAPYCNWQRTLAQRTERYALVVDDLTFRADAANMEVQTLWETSGATWNAEEGALQISSAGREALPPGWLRMRALDSEYAGGPGDAPDIKELTSIGIVLLRATEVGEWLDVPFEVAQETSGEVLAEFVDYIDRGVVRVLLDGEEAVAEYDHYAEAAERSRVSLGERTLSAGEHTLRVEVIRERGGGQRCYAGLAGILVRPDGAQPPDAVTAFEIRPCDPLRTWRTGPVYTMEWTGPVQAEGKRVHFSLIAPRTAQAGPTVCLRLAENAAALAMPEAGVAVSGGYEGINGELVVVAESHIFGRNTTLIEPNSTVVTADAPVDIDWDFDSGVVAVVASQETGLSLALDPALGVPKLDGETLGAIGGGLLCTVTIPEGAHTLTDVRMRAESRTALVAWLTDQRAKAEAERERVLAEAAGQVAPELPALAETASGSVGGDVVSLITIRQGDETLIAAAEGQTIHLLETDGSEVRTLDTDGAIRMVHWWPEHELLLAGCVDEKVIAFTLAGERKWEFVSEMHPDVFKAAKTYWFKSAPGHEGIHGLTTGLFLNGESQCFVGSACTLEILDADGQLVKRLVQFWGKVSLFQFIDGPDGSINLLAARKYNGTNTVAIINNNALDPTPRGFYSVPAGHTYVGGWSSMNRHHLFHADLDGDGVKKVVSEINGTWNRVTVWDAQGNALHDASFGPGERIMAKNMRDLEVVDLDGDGKMEILAATSAGLVVALSNECEKLWATRLPNAPTVMKTVSAADGTPVIVVGCADGTVVTLDGAGAMVKQGQVDGTPTQIEAIGTTALLATQKGEVKGFDVGE